MVKERPILFSGEMVRAILDGRKTQTRRIVKAKDSDPSRCITLRTLMANVQEWREQNGRWFGIDGYDTLVFADCPYGKAGDRLWVRETWGVGKPMNAKPASRMIRKPRSIWYAADDRPDWAGKTRPSIYMPRWASRITLEITAVRVERLNDISEEDAKAEGASIDGVGNPGGPMRVHQRAFKILWESINGDGSWSANPWVWVIEFKRVES